MPSEQTVTTSTKSWQEIVDEADPGRADRPEPAYSFGDGRSQFQQPDDPYGNPAP